MGISFKFIIVLILSISYVKLDKDADIDRKTKTQACILLSRAALHHDENYFPKIVNSFLYNDADDLVSKWTQKVLLNCLNTISMIKSADVIGRKKPENISPFAKDNKEILNVKNYHEKYAKDNAKLTKDSEKLAKVIVEVSAEFKELEDTLKKLAGDHIANLKREQMEEARRQRQEEAQEAGDYENGRLNISLITKMNPTVKYLIGFGVIALFALFFYLGIKSLMPKEEKKKQKKKN